MEEFKVSFDEVKVNELRDSITTYNNLIVRLPVDTDHNKLASKHIFQDWRRYVEESLKALVEKGKLYAVPDKHGIGTDGIEHEYTEYYVNEELTVPLVDYSYIVVEDGKANKDRFDYWSESDFI